MPGSAGAGPSCCAKRRNDTGRTGSFWEEHQDLDFLPIRRWEIWNEENIVTFADDPDPTAFATLIRISGRVLHRVDPSSKVLLGGLFGRPLQMPAQRRLGRLPLPLLPGAATSSPTSTAWRCTPTWPAPGRWGPSSTTCAGSCAPTTTPGRPLFLTELGWGSHGGPTRWERGLRGQANQLSQAFALLSAHRLEWGVAAAWWFTWTDEGGGCGFCRSAGLLTEKRRAKPAWYRFNAWTGGDPDTVQKAIFGPAGEELEVEEEPKVVAEAPAAAPTDRRR